MGYSPQPTPGWRPPQWSMRSRPAWSSSAKRGGGKPSDGPETGPPANHCGGASRLGRSTGANQTPARMAAGSRAPPGRKPGTRRRSGQQCDGGKPPGRLARADDHAADRWLSVRVGAGVPHRVLTSALQLARCTWCSATTGKTFPAPTTTWSAAFVGGSTQYRRVSGRKNWNAYLLRYGRSVAYAAWWEQDAAHRQHLQQRAAQLDRTRWRELRRETTVAQSEQLTRFRFRHKRHGLLASLEQRWTSATQSAPLP